MFRVIGLRVGFRAESGRSNWSIEWNEKGAWDYARGFWFSDGSNEALPTWYAPDFVAFIFPRVRNGSFPKPGDPNMDPKILLFLLRGPPKRYP